MQLVGLNFFAGDMPGGDRGLVSWPARSAEFRDNIDVAAGDRRTAWAARPSTRCTATGSTARARSSRTSWPPRTSRWPRGPRPSIGGSRAGRAGQRRPALPAADRRRRRRGHRPGRTRRRRRPTSGCSRDLYHLAVNGDDVDAAIAAYTPTASAHVQIADAPGRGEPGTGELDIDRQLADARRGRLRRLGRPGVQAQPASADSLDWLPREQRRVRAAPLSRTTTIDGNRRRLSMTTIAFIGLGIMGGPMAGHLADAGHDVVGYNRSPGEGRARSSSPAAAAADVGRRGGAGRRRRRA